MAFHLATLLADIGPVKFVQCDQGREFIEAVLVVLTEWGCGAPLRSAAYHPQTNGMVERGNGMLKTALRHWFIQEKTEDWYPPLQRIRYQINCCIPSTTRCSPYELMYAHKPPSFEGMIVEAPLHNDTLDRVLDEDAAAAGKARPAATGAPPMDNAASLLTSLAAGKPASPPSQPLPSSQLPAADTTVYETEVLDLPPGHAGALNRHMAHELNVGNCHFVRLGGEGGGRCALSAFYNALTPMDYLQLTAAERRDQYDTQTQGAACHVGRG